MTTGDRCYYGFTRVLLWLYLAENLNSLISSGHAARMRPGAQTRASETTWARLSHSSPRLKRRDQGESSRTLVPEKSRVHRAATSPAAQETFASALQGELVAPRRAQAAGRGARCGAQARE